jgi:hypothetical protein
MQNTHFFSLVILFAFCFVSFLIFLYFIKKRKMRSVDITPFYVYNNMAYWKRDGVLCRTKFINNKLDPDSAEIVDQLHSRDISPVDVVEILRILDRAE